MQENDNAAFLPESAEPTAVLNLDAAFAEAETIPAIIVYGRERGLTAADLKKISEDRDAAVAKLGDKLAGLPIGPIPSGDGAAAQLILQFKGSDAGQLADSSFPLFGFVFLVALGVDHNFFLMTRVREEAAVRGHRAGTLAGLAVTGGVITSAGVVLAALLRPRGVAAGVPGGGGVRVRVRVRCTTRHARGPVPAGAHPDRPHRMEDLVARGTAQDSAVARSAALG